MQKFIFKTYDGSYYSTYDCGRCESITFAGRYTAQEVVKYMKKNYHPLWGHKHEGKWRLVCI